MLGLLEKCSTTHGVINPALFLWMRLMPSVVEGSVKVSRRTEICSEIMLLPELQYVPLLDSLGTSADREIQRTLMELLTQLDGFDDLGKVKLIMATNRPVR